MSGSIEAKRYLGKRLAVVALTTGIGVGFLSGCENGQETSAEAKNASCTVTEPTTLFDPTSKELSTNQVLNGSTGALKDKGLDAGYIVQDVIVTKTEKQDVAKARNLANKIGSPLISRRTNDYIDSRLAETTRYASNNFYTFIDAHNHNNKEATAREEAVNLIANPNIRAMAEENLDMEEAKAAIRAGTGNSPRSDVATELLSFVEDVNIKSLAQQAIGGNSDAVKAFDNQASERDIAIQKLGSDIMRSLYDGSNSQARSINSQIDRFNAARQKDGQ